jgi:hypothetical protein
MREEEKNKNVRMRTSEREKRRKERDSRSDICATGHDASECKIRRHLETYGMINIKRMEVLDRL